MTFKDLQKVVESQPGQNLNQLQKLRGLPFWYWDKTRHKERDRITKGECCFNHCISLPKKDGKEYPLFNYEQQLYKALLQPGYLNNYPNSRSHPDYPNNVMYPFKEKHLFIKKATGIGVTTFMLRFMAWLCLYNDDYCDSQMVIVVGPNQELAIKLIKRMKTMFADKLAFETCIYKKIFLDYTYGLGKIYTQEEIDKARVSPSFPREYELQYLGLIGNVFSQLSIENACKLEYNPNNINLNAKKSVGVDAGFGSSKFAIVVTQFVDGKIQVIFAEEYERPNFAAMINRIWEIKQKCGYISNIYTDAANPEIWESLKREFNEPFNHQYMSSQIADYKKFNLHLEDRMIVVPVPFSVEGAHMLQHIKWLMEETDEDGSSLIAIHRERFDKLITALRTAVANEYKLDKEVTSYDDILDAFRLSLQFYKRSKG